MHEFYNNLIKMCEFEIIEENDNKYFGVLSLKTQYAFITNLNLLNDKNFFLVNEFENTKFYCDELGISL